MNKKSSALIFIFIGQIVDVIPAPYTQGKVKITVEELKKAIVAHDENYANPQISNQESLEKITMMIKRISQKELNKRRTETPLMVAAQRGMVEVTRILIAHGALADVKDKNDHDALWFAHHVCSGDHCKEVAENIEDSRRQTKAKKVHKNRSTRSKPSLYMPAKFFTIKLEERELTPTLFLCIKS